MRRCVLIYFVHRPAVPLGSCIQNPWGQKVFVLIHSLTRFILIRPLFIRPIHISFNSLTCDSIFGSLNWELAGCDLLISFPFLKKLKCPLCTLSMFGWARDHVSAIVRYTHNTYPLINIPILFARLLDSDIENIGEQRSGGYRRLFFPIQFL